MASSAVQSTRIARFGPFELDLQSGEIRKYGIRVKVHGQPIQILSVLLEKAGQVVSREELRNRLWSSDTFVEFEHSLNTAVKRLRHALADSADDPHYIETLPRVGYRFIAPVVFEASAIGNHRVAVPHSIALTEEAEQTINSRGSARVRSFAKINAIGIGVASLGFLSYALLSAPPTAHVVRSFQAVASDRIESWQRPVTDGVRIYLMERAGNHTNLVQTSTSGGDMLPVEPPFGDAQANTVILDISRDRSKFLIGQFHVIGGLLSLWVWPVQGGSPVRIGTRLGSTAAWRPDGTGIVYGYGGEIHSVDVDGKNDRLLSRATGAVQEFRWSPDGARLSYSVRDYQTNRIALWEATADGGNAHQRFAPRGDISDVCCGEWSPDGKYFLFVAIRSGIDNVWAVRETRSLLHWRKPEPVQLTFSATPLYSTSRLIEGTRLFALGERSGFQSVKLDLKTGRTTPLLPDTQVVGLSYSRDGKQMAFSINPTSSIWRSDPDGRSQLQLVAPPLECDRPVWSPDGKKISFEASMPGEAVRAYVVDANGGTPRDVVALPGMQSLPYWSPDGNSLAVAMNPVPKPGSTDPRGIYIVNASSRQAVVVPHSTGFTSPMWSPDGAYFTAKSVGDGAVFLFHPDLGTWTKIAEGASIAGPYWSPDSKYLYFQELTEPGQPLYRLLPPQFKKERVFSFEALLSAGVQRCAIQAVAPDGSPIISLTRSSARAYIFDLDLP